MEIKSCTKNDKKYPKKLKSLHSSPNIIYYVGDISICNDEIVAVIGKRDSKERNLMIAERIGKTVSKKSFVLLNGLAIGCDAHAIKGAVSVKGKVIAVMPGGLDKIYPAQNKKLAEEIINNGGCLISEYPTGVKPKRYSFVERDKLQAMLCSKVIVIDADKDGGTMHTVKYSQRYNRPIGCVLDKEVSSGNIHLIDNKTASSIVNDDSLNLFLVEEEYTQQSMFI